MSRATGAGTKRVYAIGQVAGWGAYTLLGIAITGSFNRLDASLVVTTLLGGTFGGVASHLLRGVILRRGWLGLRLGALVPRLAGGVIAAALAVEVSVLFTGIYLTHAYTWHSSTPAILFVTTFNWMITILLWVAIYVGSQSFVRWRDAEIQRLRLEVLARDAQLDALNAQIQPHFLFNALNVLRAMIPEDPARARDLVTELSELMRYALQAGRRDHVALAEELTVVESYLQVESARFEERLRWRIEVDDAARGATLPPMLLQMLVENAVKHGIAASESGGEVCVRAGCENGRVRLRVTNPGRLGRAGDTRIGLANARERLRLLYGEHASLRLAEEDGLVIAEVVLPAGAAS